MSDIDPQEFQKAVESTPGIWAAMVTGLTGLLAAVGGFVFKDQNVRLKAIERCQIDIKDGFSKMATRNDVNDIHKKIDQLTSDNTARIIDILKNSK